MRNAFRQNIKQLMHLKEERAKVTPRAMYFTFLDRVNKMHELFEATLLSRLNAYNYTKQEVNYLTKVYNDWKDFRVKFIIEVNRQPLFLCCVDPRRCQIVTVNLKTQVNNKEDDLSASIIESLVKSAYTYLYEPLRYRNIKVEYNNLLTVRGYIINNNAYTADILNNTTDVLEESFFKSLVLRMQPLTKKQVSLQKRLVEFTPSHYTYTVEGLPIGVALSKLNAAKPYRDFYCSRVHTYYIMDQDYNLYSLKDKTFSELYYGVKYKSYYKGELPIEDNYITSCNTLKVVNITPSSVTFTDTSKLTFVQTDGLPEYATSNFLKSDFKINTQVEAPLKVTKANQTNIEITDAKGKILNVPIRLEKSSRGYIGAYSLFFREELLYYDHCR